jgi:hypothetical protein
MMSRNFLFFQRFLVEKNCEIRPPPSFPGAADPFFAEKG